MTTPRFEPAAPEPHGAVPPEPFRPAPPEPGAVEPGAVEPAATQPVLPRSARPANGGARALNLALGAAVVVAAAGIAFAAGRFTAPAAAATSVGNGSVTLPSNLGDDERRGFLGGYFPADGQRGSGLGGLGGGLTIEGTVESVADDSITIETAAGTTVTVGLSADTEYHRQADASASDVATGSTVTLRLSGGFRPGGNGGSDGTSSLGTASDVTIVQP